MIVCTNTKNRFSDGQFKKTTRTLEKFKFWARWGLVFEIFSCIYSGVEKNRFCANLNKINRLGVVLVFGLHNDHENHTLAHKDIN